MYVWPESQECVIANVVLNPGSERHDLPKIIVGEDLWKDLRHG